MRTRILFTVGVIGIVAMSGFVSGCSSLRASRVGDDAARPEASGSRLWAQNCARCHNIRSPDSYSDQQWEVAMMHMRVRANLTAEEQRVILEFLKSAN